MFSLLKFLVIYPDADKALVEYFNPLKIRAIRRGSRQHHWKFGDMPAVAGVPDNAAKAIIEFVRWFRRQSSLY